MTFINFGLKTESFSKVSLAPRHDLSEPLRLNAIQSLGVAARSGDDCVRAFCLESLERRAYDESPVALECKKKVFVVIFWGIC